MKARSAFRAKTANAAEKCKDQLTNERGDLAVAKELRQRMFEQRQQYVDSALSGSYKHDSTTIRRPFDCLSKVIKVTAT